MSIRDVFLIIMLLAFAPMSAYADNVRTVAYSRAHIVIIRKNAPAVSTLPWLGKAAQAQAMPIGFDVEVRDAASLYNQKGWFNLSDMATGSGIMMVFGYPKLAPIVHATQYAPLDILMVDDEGKIIQIIPSIKLSELEQDIMPPGPVLAFLFVKGGTCASNSISPGDTIEYNIFKRPPVVVSVQQDKK